MNIQVIRDPSHNDWLHMRAELWPQLSLVEHQSELEKFVTDPRFKAFIVLSSDNLSSDSLSASQECIGFAEAYLRNEYVNGCETSPVVFLEGIFVRPAFRRQGIARRLCTEIERWARSQGCTEFASDVLLDNLDSQAMHVHLGFEETERVVCFKKLL
ncbi:MAG: aminoglycoside 6'-N-acetyltransferase [Cyanobacteria bacterium J06626_14]